VPVFFSATAQAIDEEMQFELNRLIAPWLSKCRRRRWWLTASIPLPLLLRYCAPCYCADLPWRIGLSGGQGPANESGCGAPFSNCKARHVHFS